MNCKKQSARLQFQSRRGEGLLKFTPPELDYPGWRKKAALRKKEAEAEKGKTKSWAKGDCIFLPRRRIKLNNSAEPICISKLSQILAVKIESCALPLPRE
jgi:hypothetical protein